MFTHRPHPHRDIRPPEYTHTETRILLYPYVHIGFNSPVTLRY